jgi:hypothetical protein
MRALSHYQKNLDLPTEFFVDIYTHSLSARIFLTGSQTKIIRQKILVGDLWYVGESVNNIFTDGLTNRQSMPKKNYQLHSIRISINEYNISSTENPYVILSVSFFA